MQTGSYDTSATLRRARPREWSSRAVMGLVAVVALLPLALTVAPALGAAHASERDLLGLAEALDRARRVSPELATAREAVEVARGHERQAGAFANPSVEYVHEETSRGDVEGSEDTLVLSQPLEITGTRGLRREAARLRREAAEARTVEAEAQLAFEVRRAYALAVAADARAAATRQAADEFSAGRRIRQRRYAEGDVSGYALRRLELEAARFAGVEAEHIGESRDARIALAALIGSEDEVALAARYEFSDRVDGAVDAPAVSIAQLRELALGRRPDLRALELELQASEVEVALRRRERIPTPVLEGGYKTERAADASRSLRTRGFVVGVSVPLPLWDRDGGGIDALAAESRRHNERVRSARRRVLRELEEAWVHFEVAAARLEAIRPHLGIEAEAILRAARTAYAEGEISLIEWLDAVRAYHEARSTFASVVSSHFVQRAALDLAAGEPLEPRSQP